MNKISSRLGRLALGGDNEEVNFSDIRDICICGRDSAKTFACICKSISYCSLACAGNHASEHSAVHEVCLKFQPRLENARYVFYQGTFVNHYVKPCFIETVPSAFDEITREISRNVFFQKIFGINAEIKVALPFESSIRNEIEKKENHHDKIRKAIKLYAKTLALGDTMELVVVAGIILTEYQHFKVVPMLAGYHAGSVYHPYDEDVLIMVVKYKREEKEFNHLVDPILIMSCFIIYKVPIDRYEYSLPHDIFKISGHEMRHYRVLKYRGFNVAYLPKFQLVQTHKKFGLDDADSAYEEDEPDYPDKSDPGYLDLK
jgi:hypothetical protein